MKKTFKLFWAISLFSNISAFAQSAPSNPAVPTQLNPVLSSVQVAIPPVYYSPLDIQYSTKDGDNDFKTLRIVSKGKTAGLVAAKVGLFALSILGGLNGVYVPTDTSGFNKNQLTGHEIDDAQNMTHVENPSELVRNKIQSDFTEAALKNPKLKEKTLGVPIKIWGNLPGWKMIYDKLAGEAEGDNKYHIEYGMKILLASYQGPVFSGLVSEESCSYKSESKNLDDWKANDYQAVADERIKVANECATQLRPKYERFIGADALAAASKPLDFSKGWSIKKSELTTAETVNLK